jgi:hypothetical protein
MKTFSNAELFAVFVSVTSVSISLIGNRTQERLLAASVWPYLSFNTGNTSDDGQHQVISLAVVNSGNGPARIREFTLEYDHKNAAAASSLLRECCDLKPANLLTSPVVGKVLRPGEQVILLQLPFAEDIAEGWRRFDKARFQFVFSACYCSTLNECWTIRSDQADPSPVAACRDMPREEQWHG